MSEPGRQLGLLDGRSGVWGSSQLHHRITSHVCWRLRVPSCPSHSGRHSTLLTHGQLCAQMCSGTCRPLLRVGAGPDVMLNIHLSHNPTKNAAYNPGRTYIQSPLLQSKTSGSLTGMVCLTCIAPPATAHHGHIRMSTNLFDNHVYSQLVQSGTPLSCVCSRHSSKLRDLPLHYPPAQPRR